MVDGYASPDSGRRRLAGASEVAIPIVGEIPMWLPIGLGALVGLGVIVMAALGAVAFSTTNSLNTDGNSQLTSVDSFCLPSESYIFENYSTGLNPLGPMAGVLTVSLALQRTGHHVHLEANFLSLPVTVNLAINRNYRFFSLFDAACIPPSLSFTPENDDDLCIAFHPNALVDSWIGNTDAQLPILAEANVYYGTGHSNPDPPPFTLDSLPVCASVGSRNFYGFETPVRTNGSPYIFVAQTFSLDYITNVPHDWSAPERCRIGPCAAYS